MRLESQRYRWLESRLPDPGRRRLVVLTGARQVGKTTLARGRYPGLRYVNLDAIEDREALRAVRTEAWARDVGVAVLDEAHKEPAVFEKVKHAYDAGGLGFSVLLGSSRVLLLDRVKESLAGRAFVYELWPLMLSEVLLEAGAADPARPLFDRILEAAGPGEGRTLDTALVKEPASLLGSDEGPRIEALDHLRAWGGMPELISLPDGDREDWLRSYQQTYIERDLADLVRTGDPVRFRTFQKLAMLRSGRLLSVADLARDAGVSPSTAQRWLGHLEVSYQALLLRPYSRNLTSTLVKAPKLYATDMGLLRQAGGRSMLASGEAFETLVVLEAHKWLATTSRDAALYHYRTRSGLEVDMIVETPAGILGIEAKSRGTAARADARGLSALADSAADRWLGGLVVNSGREISLLDEARSIWSVPVHRLF